MTAMRDKQQDLCTGLIIRIDAIDGKVFIDEQEVKDILAAEAGGQVKGTSLKRFDLRRMEKRLMQEVWIEQAQLYVDNAGVMHANLAERVPVARLFDVTGNSFYIDSTGKQLPLSAQERADLPVFTNVPVLNKNNKAHYDSALHDVVSIANVVRRDSFWNAQAAQIDLLGNGRYEMYPAIGYHKIELGNANDMASKLDRLKIFYHDVLANKPLNAYSLLSVAYKDQVVAVKGDGQMPGIDPAKAVEVFNQLVTQTKNEVNANAVESEQKQGRIMPEYGNAAGAAKTQAKEPVAPIQPTPAKKDSNTMQSPRAVMPAKTTNN
jgi:cell division protein FtsQ